jgi:hypothetical protein
MSAINELSDFMAHNLILFMMLGFYVIIVTTHYTIMARLDWITYKCDPYFMLVKSFIDMIVPGSPTQDNENTFDKCVTSVAKKQLYDDHRKQMKKNQDKLDKALNDLNQKSENEMTNLKLENNELLTLIGSTNDSIDDVIKLQNSINETIVKSSEPINELTSKVEEVSKQFKITMNTFINSNLVDNLKEEE